MKCLGNKSPAMVKRERKQEKLFQIRVKQVQLLTTTIEKNYKTTTKTS